MRDERHNRRRIDRGDGGVRMKINGIEIPPEVIDACLERMRLERFRCLDIIDAARNFKATTALEYTRIANRLIQRERKAKRIRAVDYPYWEPVRKADA